MGITGTSITKARIALGELQAEWKASGDGVIYVPVTAKKADYDKLIDAIDESIRQNEGIAALKQRIKKLGAAVTKLATTLGVVV